ncbi:protein STRICTOSIDINE SYNTHASE-LIKE 2-like [Salvia splendens]|uniref:protein STRICTOSIDINE SYNTHASE-LIKE 2-like n=1 Tax=Salvia splendens TaxID=180675 RepID=UPI001C254F36|nr:protein STRICTOSIDINE SYNTHASE-LIKE 2-like [Salvia splendens]
MSVPMVFQAKAMTTKLILSTAFLALLISISLLYFDSEYPSILHQQYSNNNATIKFQDAVGLESFDFDGGGGGPYTGVSDGRIIRWQANESRWVDFAVTSPDRKFVSAIMSGDDSGRVMKFDARTRKTSVLVDKLKFPNGVALSRNGDFLLSVETTTCKLYKLWLKTRNVEVVIEFLGFPPLTI